MSHLIPSMAGGLVPPIWTGWFYFWKLCNNFFPRQRGLLVLDPLPWANGLLWLGSQAAGRQFGRRKLCHDQGKIWPFLEWLPLQRRELPRLGGPRGVGLFNLSAFPLIQDQVWSASLILDPHSSRMIYIYIGTPELIKNRRINITMYNVYLINYFNWYVGRKQEPM